MEHLSLQQIIVFLVAAGLIVPLFKSINLSPVLGFILVGMCVGPNGLVSLLPDQAWTEYVLITDQQSVKALAELGVIFLLFMIGLDLSFSRLWAMKKLVFGMGNVQIVATAVTIGGLAYAWGNPLETAIIIGGCLALSSTAIVLELLVAQERFGSPAGHASFAILLAQDLAVVPLLFLVASFASTSSGSTGADLGFAIIRALGTMALIFVVGRVVLRPLFLFVGKLHSSELFMATTLLVVIALSSVTHAVGLSAALGAFLAGLLLAESEYHHDIELYIQPFKGLLLGLFFMSVAMDINLYEVAGNPLWIALSVAGLFLLKATITTCTMRLFGFQWSHSIEAGTLLAQGGEFAFVVLGLALSLLLIPPEIAQFMLIVVSATMFLTPVIAYFSQKVGALFESHQEPSVDFIEDYTDHIILVGHGRTGRLIGEMLNQHMIPYVCLDRDATLARQGVQVGDASRTQILQKFQIHRARALVICINEPNTVQHIVEAARRLVADIPILARAHDEQQARHYLDLGATAAVPEVLESGLKLAELLLQEIAVSEHASAEIVTQLRQQAHTRMTK